jgi:hypothetical protein
MSAIQAIPYHFDSYGHGLQDAIVYYHRKLTTAEISRLSGILSSLLHRKHRGAIEQFWLAGGDFSEALLTLKKQIDSGTT